MIAEAASSSGLSPTDLDDSFAITYDSLYRMTSATGPGQGSHDYRFDKVGNMLAQTYNGDPRFRPESTGTLQYGGPGRGPQALARVASDQGAPDTEFGYDANGNLTTISHGDVTASKEWDPKDRLVAASEGGITNTHTYDYASKRVIHRQTRNGGDPRLTLYIDDVSEFRDGRLVKYIYVGSEKVARSDFSAAPGTPVVPDTFFLHDHLGSTLVAMDGSAAIHQISSYAPYGRNRFTGLGGASAIDYAFSGKESHDGPDLAYFETRFLAPAQARFTQPDTLTLNPPEDWRLHPQKWHPYSYTWGNPMTMVDPDGREAYRFETGGASSADQGVWHAYAGITPHVTTPAGSVGFELGFKVNGSSLSIQLCGSYGGPGIGMGLRFAEAGLREGAVTGSIAEVSTALEADAFAAYGAGARISGDLAKGSFDGNLNNELLSGIGGGDVLGIGGGIGISSRTCVEFNLSRWFSSEPRKSTSVNPGVTFEGSPSSLQIPVEYGGIYTP